VGTDGGGELERERRERCRRERERERKRQEETNHRRSRWIQAAAVILRRAAVASGRERARLRERSKSAGESSVLAEDKVLHVGLTGCNFAKKQSAADKSLGTNKPITLYIIGNHCHLITIGCLKIVSDRVFTVGYFKTQ
jgi:hypothetical protein